MKVGSLVRKKKGTQLGRIGIITRIFNSDPHPPLDNVIFEVLSEGLFCRWAAGWCELSEDEDKQQYKPAILQGSSTFKPLRLPTSC